jgi:hypothetical protein
MSGETDSARGGAGADIILGSEFLNMSHIELKRFKCLIEHLSKLSANRDWALAVLSTLTHGGHTFFE